MTRTLIIISTLTASIFGSCKSTPELTEDEVYTIINEIIVDDSLEIDKVCWKFQEINLTSELKKEFTKQDLKFIGEQKKLYKNMTVQPNKLKWFNRRKKLYEYSIIDSICKDGFLTHISFPIISADRQKVIIEIQSFCNCQLGGSGSKKIYEKKNGRWVCVMNEFWISLNQKK